MIHEILQKKKEKIQLLDAHKILTRQTISCFVKKNAQFRV